MISRYRVKLGNKQMDSLHDDLIILDVGYPAFEFSHYDNRIANLDGFDSTDSYLERREITVSFELHIYDIAERNAACQAVNAWAKSNSTLRVNDREGQHINVRVKTYAAIESAKNWTDPLNLVFETVGVPYWQSDDESIATLSGSSASGTLTLDGNIGSALVSVDVVPKTNISALRLTCGGNSIQLNGLSASPTNGVKLDYINGRYLRIQQGGRSVLHLMSGSDNLKASCGGNTSVSVVASGSVTATFHARGLWI